MTKTYEVSVNLWIGFVANENDAINKFRRTVEEAEASIFEVKEVNHD